MVIEILHDLVLGTLHHIRGVLDQLRIIGGMDGWWGGIIFGLGLLQIVARIAVARTERRPSYLLDLKELQHEWASSTWYWKVFMPFLSLFVLGYLAIAWAVHGAQVLLELVVRALHLVLRAILWLWKWLVWLLGKLWWGLQWVWREVIDVTIVFLLKLVWHYVFVWSYRFLYWCLHKAFAGYTWTLLRAGAPHMLMTVFLVVLGTWASSLAGAYWPLGCLALPAYLVLLGGAGTVLHHADGRSGQPAWRMALYRHPLIWALGGVLAVGLFVVLGQVPLPGVRMVLWGLSLDIALVVVPITFLLVFAFVSAAAMLPAHARANDGKVELLPFAKAAAWRFLKYATATPYKALGIGIVSILPVVLGALLFAGITGTTGLVGGAHPADQQRLTELEAAWQKVRSSCTTVDQAKNVSGSCSDLMAARIQNGKVGITQSTGAWPEAITNTSRGFSDATLTEAQLEERRVRYRADSAMAQAAVDTAQATLHHVNDELEAVRSLAAKVLANGITTFEGNAYAGETQTFGAPATDADTRYEWRVVSGEKDIVQMFTGDVFYHRWAAEGSFEVVATPVNDCGKGEPLSIGVTVAKPQVVMGLYGDATACEGVERTYQASPNGLSGYEWEVPEGAAIITASESKVTVRFGDRSGLVRVRATADNGPTTWASVAVAINCLPGKTAGPVVQPMQDPPSTPPARSKMFHTLREARAAETEAAQQVEQAQALLDKAIARGKIISIGWTLDAAELHATINATRWHNFRWIITSLLAAVAMSVLLAMVMLPAWLYNVLKNAELYGYHEDGTPYAHEIVRGYRARDERQPVMGWIILLLAVGLAWVWNVQGGLADRVEHYLQRTRATAQAWTIGSAAVPVQPATSHRAPSDQQDRATQEGDDPGAKAVTVTTEAQELSEEELMPELVVDPQSMEDPMQTAAAMEAVLAEQTAAIQPDEGQLELMEKNTSNCVVAGTFSGEANARNRVDQLLALGMTSARVWQRSDGRFTAIAQGPFSSREEANKAAAALKLAGIDVIVTDL